MRSNNGQNNKFLFYASGILKELWPDILYRLRLNNHIEKMVSGSDKSFIERLHYYNKLKPGVELVSETPTLGDLRWPRKGRVYYLDARDSTRYFNSKLKANFLFGDFTHLPAYPTFIKSRPITERNHNSVLLKLNKVRHYAFIDDTVPFEKKNNRLIGMAEVRQPNRIDFYKKWFGHPMMDLGQINRGTSHDHWIKPRLSISDHLKYKFILCLEGFDIATNLKWVMSSGSLAVMPPPTNESWFMESKLIPDHHYVAVKPDFSDVEERLNYFISNPEHARFIIENANSFVDQFMDVEKEFLLGLAVMLKYFECTGQISQRFLIPDFFHAGS